MDSLRGSLVRQAVDRSRDRSDGARQRGILCLPGPPWVPHLAGKHRVLRPDMPGFGASTEPPDYGWSIGELTADIARFMDKLAIEKCHLIGAKYGGSVCLRLAHRQIRIACTSLCLFGSPVRGSGTANADADPPQRRAAVGRRHHAVPPRQLGLRRAGQLVDGRAHGKEQPRAPL